MMPMSPTETHGALFLLRTLTEVWGGVNVGFTAMLLWGLHDLQRGWTQARLTAGPSTAATQTPPIAILRPCEGDEPGLAENLRSSLLSPYDGPRQVLFLVPSVEDPAHAIAQAVVRDTQAPATTARVVVTDPPPLCNRKVWQLEIGLAACPADWVVCADSDVRFASGDLPALLAPLLSGATAAAGSDRPVGAVFAAPIEVAPQTAWDRAGADLVTASAQSFLALFAMQALIARLTRRPNAPQMAGALCAFPRAALSHIGGIARFRDCLGEDNEIARQLTLHGYRIAVAPRPAHCYDGGRDRAAVIARVARWQTVVRAQRPALWPTYPLMLGATPGVWLLAIAWPSPTLSSFAMLLLLLRTLLSGWLLRLQGLPAGPVRALTAVLSAETLIWIAFWRSARSRTIQWRGHPFRVESGGRLRPASTPPS